ncbi:DUF1611 domain-containing protein [Sphingorhabdus sp.]|jgi:uncharacterized NAD-dependent epimerase/dehydratase family protein|uniref:DUF1611 domain-containing protein n=3 Tax=Sphingorhabdus sp. TaxID=1902408 RepID=UPI003BAFA8D0|nr:DUF1611 domain-containing protein [Sphingomonadales bacterium]MBK9433373.1 DUF1611 domain-containing protein [Sphingomonadales bacterium]
MSEQISGGYLLFLGHCRSKLDTKTASGILQWRPDRCIGQFRLSEDAVDLGLPDIDPVEAVTSGARTMVVGVAPVGGAIQPEWVQPIIAALDAGMDVAAGMHSKLSDNPDIAAAALTNGRQLFDVRHASGKQPIATGEKRLGRRLLTVGTDCASGKKYTALAVHAEMARRGLEASFRATGQTGILISGEGVAIDAVVSDFAAGAAESLSPNNHPDHWDIIEGQGSLFHPAYAGVSLSLLHGSQPDAIIVCHEPGRQHIDDYPSYLLPDIMACIDANLTAARLTNPDVRCVGIALDTSRLNDTERNAVIRKMSAETGLLVFDPVATGASELVDLLVRIWPGSDYPNR